MAAAPENVAEPHPQPPQAPEADHAGPPEQDEADPHQKPQEQGGQEQWREAIAPAEPVGEAPPEAEAHRAAATQAQGADALRDAQPAAGDVEAGAGPEPPGRPVSQPQPSGSFLSVTRSAADCHGCRCRRGHSPRRSGGLAAEPVVAGAVGSFPRLGELPDQYGRRFDEVDGETPVPLDPCGSGLPPIR